MAVLKMQRLTVCALKKDRKAILEKLQSMGVLQVDPVSGDDRDFRKMDTAGQRMGFEKAAASADQALDILDKYVPEKKSVFSALEGRKVITTEMEAAVRKKRKELLRTARQICDLDRDRAEQLGLITKLENSIESLEPWMNLDVPVKTQRTRRTVLMPGTMPATNILDTDRPVMVAAMIMGTEGGMMGPRQLEAAVTATEKGAS